MIFYCDGASRKDGRGGWGFAVFDGEVEVFSCLGGDFDTTNNRMELQAAIEALSYAKETRCMQPVIVCDSQYVIKGITEDIDLWLKTNWRTGGNQPLKNKDLWAELCDLDIDVRPRWRWVRGHTGVRGNERADQLAQQGVPRERVKP